MSNAQLQDERYRVIVETQVTAVSGDHAEGFIKTLLKESPETLQHLITQVNAQKIDAAVPGYLRPSLELREAVVLPDDEMVTIPVKIFKSHIQTLVDFVYLTNLEPIVVDEQRQAEGSSQKLDWSTEKQVTIDLLTSLQDYLQQHPELMRQDV